MNPRINISKYDVSAIKVGQEYRMFDGRRKIGTCTFHPNNDEGVGNVTLYKDMFAKSTICIEAKFDDNVPDISDNHLNKARHMLAIYVQHKELGSTTDKGHAGTFWNGKIVLDGIVYDGITGFDVSPKVSVGDGCYIQICRRKASFKDYEFNFIIVRSTLVGRSEHDGFADVSDVVNTMGLGDKALIVIVKKFVKDHKDYIK